MIVKGNCRIAGVDCPMLEKRIGKHSSSFYYRCRLHDRELKTVEICEYAGDFNKQMDLASKETKGELTMAEKMKQTLVETKQKVSDLLEAEWDNVVKAYENHGYSLSAGIKITLDGESVNVINVVTVLSFYPFPKTEIKTDKITVDEKQKKLF